jgi:hypothetical protein
LRRDNYAKRRTVHFLENENRAMARCGHLAKLVAISGRSFLRTTLRLATTISLSVAVAFFALIEFDPRSSSAQGFFETLFGGNGYGYGPDRRASHWRERPWRHGRGWRQRDRFHLERHAHRRRLRDTGGEIAQRSDVDASSGPPPIARQLVCVRMCDAFYFPVVDPGDKAYISTAESLCQSLCPNSKTRLYLIPSGSHQIEKAAAARGGALYSELAARAQAGQKKGRSCSCRAGDADEPLAVYSDLTLQPGDSVMTKQGLRIFRGANHFPFNKNDFLSLARAPGFTRQMRVTLLAIEGASKRPQGQGNFTGARSRTLERSAGDPGHRKPDASSKSGMFSHN